MRFFKQTSFMLTLITCLLIVLLYPIKTNASEFEINEENVLGTWQIIIDGESSEGSFFYRLDFQDDNNVTVIKQYGGKNIQEDKTWKMTGDHLIIDSDLNDEITEFDNALLQVTDEQTIECETSLFNASFHQHHKAPAFFHWILILVVLMALNELFRRSKYAGIIFFFILPIVLLPVWTSYGVSYWFKWVKLYSVVFASAWFILMRFTKLGKLKTAKMIAALFLAINILEAVIQDFSMGYLPNILNGIAGILSILTLFYGWKGIQADNSKVRDLVWPKMTIFWIIAYDIWNIVFVYLNFPGSTSAQFMVLLACTIPALFIKKGTWLQARAFTLAIWFMYYFTFPRFTESMELLVPRNDTLMLLAALISILANLIYAVIYIKIIYNNRKTTVLTA